MAFPTYTRTTGNSAGDATTHSITLPATIAAGDLLLIVASVDGDPSTMSFSGAGTWTSLYNTTGTNIARCAQWKVADGTEDGATVTLTLGVTQQAAWQIYLISATQGSLESVAGGSSGSSSTVTFNTLTPSWGADDTLWVEVIHNSNTPTVSSYSTNFADGARTVSTGSDNTMIATATRSNNAASESPGNATLSAAQAYAAYLIGVRPVAGSSLTDVDTDEIIYTGQTAIAYTGTGLTDADGLVVRTDTTCNASATSFSATNATSGTFTAPSLDACFTAGTKFGSCTFDIQDGGVSLGTLAGTINPASAYTVHTVSDISQATDPGTVYYWVNNAGTDVAVGDQIIFDNKSGNVTVDSQGFLTFANGETSTTYRARDDTDNTWSAVWSTFWVVAGTGFVKPLAQSLASNLIKTMVH